MDRAAHWAFFGILFCGFIVDVEAVACPYCGEEFQVLGRHLWRCLARGSSPGEAVQGHPITAPIHSATARGIPSSTLDEPTELPNQAKEARPRLGRRTHARATSPTTTTTVSTTATTTGQRPPPTSLLTHLPAHGLRLSPTRSMTENTHPAQPIEHTAPPGLAAASPQLHERRVPLPASM